MDLIPPEDMEKYLQLFSQQMPKTQAGNWQQDFRGRTEYMDKNSPEAQQLINDRANAQQIINQRNQMMQTPPNFRRINYQSTVIKPPGQVLIQYIGGPKNAEQEYLEYRSFQGISDGTLLTIRNQIFEPPTIDQNGLISNITRGMHEMIYRITYIPMDQTPFSDAQIIVAIFQEPISLDK